MRSYPIMPSRVGEPDWRIPVFPRLDISPRYARDPFCGCTIAWSPLISGIPGRPFVVKFTYLACPLGHYQQLTPKGR